MRSMGTVTILIPCYNEEDSLPPLFERMNRLITSHLNDTIYSLLFVDDGSSDTTKKQIKKYSDSHPFADYIFLSRNFGKEKAMYAGICNVNTDALVIIDADLQDPPELIPNMIDLWKQGYDDVYARRRKRSGETVFKTLTSHWYYSLLQMISGIEIQEDTGDFRLLDRKCVDAMKELDESERNTKALFSWIGFKKIEFLYDRDPRVAGKSKWGITKLIRLAIDGITSFTTLPLHFATYLGILVSFSAIVYALVTLINTLSTGIKVPGYSSTLIVVLILGALQLLSLGIIGEYLGRIFTQTKNRPNYLIQEKELNNQINAGGNGSQSFNIKESSGKSVDI